MILSISFAGRNSLKMLALLDWREWLFVVSRRRDMRLALCISTGDIMTEATESAVMERLAEADPGPRFRKSPASQRSLLSRGDMSSCRDLRPLRSCIRLVGSVPD